MSNLTPKLEDLFERIYDMLDAASKGEDIGPLVIRDALKELEVEVEEAIANAGLCAECQCILPPLCNECLEEEGARWEGRYQPLGGMEYAWL